MTRPDLIVRDVRVVRPGGGEPFRADIAIADGVVAEVGPDLAVPEGTEVHEGRGLLAFPGVVDAHQHWGIYNPLSEDTATESRACAQGGVTTSLTYMRTGQYYLNRGGPYSEVFPEVLAASEGLSLIHI